MPFELDPFVLARNAKPGGNTRAAVDCCARGDVSAISAGCGLRAGKTDGDDDDDEGSAGRWDAAIRDVEAAEERNVLPLPERL